MSEHPRDLVDDPSPSTSWWRVEHNAEFPADRLPDRIAESTSGWGQLRHPDYRLPAE